jgi:hypothetical protein
MISTEQRGLTCQPVMWSAEGPCLSHDVKDAFRFEVRERGVVIGFITVDRALRHPEAMWKRSRFRDGKIEELEGQYRTVEEALATF